MTANTATQERELAAAAAREAFDSFERCDTDGFASQAANGIMSRVHSLRADIADNGGRWHFPALFDLDGNLVAAKLIHSQYGWVWGVLEDDDPRGRVVAWVNPSNAAKATTRNRNLAKKGYSEGLVLAEAGADTWAPDSARGFGGLGSVQVVAYRRDGGFSRDVEVVSTVQTEDY